MPRRKPARPQESEIVLENDPERIRVALRTLRAALGLSQKDVSAAMGFKSSSSVSGRETSKVKGRASVDEELEAMKLTRAELEVADKFAHFIQAIAGGVTPGGLYLQGALMSPFDFVAESGAARELDRGLAETIEDTRRQGHATVDSQYRASLGLLLRSRPRSAEVDSGDEI